MESNSPTEPGLLNCHEQDSIGAHRFAHQAMATIFEVICLHDDREYAGQAARAAFELIDRLESELTCHRGPSDISRINRLKPGEDAVVGTWTMECLVLARHFQMETHGAFDVSLGSGLEAVELIPADLRVRIHAEDVRLDLGGIGKGYAIDRAWELLQEWEINIAVIHGGFSSALLLDPPPGHAGWPLTISTPGEARVLERVEARQQAWSASGIRKENHIVDPHTGLPIRNRNASWVSGSLTSLSAVGRANNGLARVSDLETGDSPAAVAEALSTAFMIMPLEEVRNYCGRYKGIAARLLIPDPSSPTAAPVLVKMGAQ